MNANYQIHYPVMLNEVLENLSVGDNKIYVDATFGNGGYSEAILNKANCKLIALDRDSSVLPRVEEMKKQYGDRFEFRSGCFGDFADLISEDIDGAVFDIGVSSMQLDQAERGFSFSKDARSFFISSRSVLPSAGQEDFTTGSSDFVAKYLTSFSGI